MAKFLLDRPVPFTITEGPLAGMEFTASVRVGLEDHVRLARLVTSLTTVDDDETAIAEIREAAEIVAPRIRSWNLETDDGPLPISVESLLDIGPAPFGTIIGLWRDAVRTGGQSPLASTPPTSTPSGGSSPSASSRAQRRARTPR